MKNNVFRASLALAVSLALSASAVAQVRSPYTPGLGNDTSITPKEAFKRAAEDLNAKRYAEAIRGFEAVLAAAPDDTTSWTYKGLAELSLNQYAAAQSSFKRALRIDNSLVMTRANLIMADLSLNQKPAAQTELKSMQDQAARCRDTCPQAADLKAYIAALEPKVAN